MLSVVSFGAIQRSHQQRIKSRQQPTITSVELLFKETYTIAARFFDNRNPVQKPFSIIHFGGRGVGSGSTLGKMSEESLPFVLKMDQQEERLSTLHRSHKPIPQGYSLPQSRQPIDENKPVSKGISPPQENRGGRNLERSTSRSGPKKRSSKPEADTAHEPGYIKPHFDNTDIRFTADAFKGDKKEKARPEVQETAPTHDFQISSHQGASRSKSVNTDFTSEGSSTAVPEAQTCLYIIKQGISYAIPHRLEPGLRDTVNNALRLQPSQKSVYKKIASLSPENIAALETVLDDGGIGPQTRRLVHLSILQKALFQIGSSKEDTVLAIVEDPDPQRPWRDDEERMDENEEHLPRRPSYPVPLPLEHRPATLSDRFGPKLDEHLGSRGRSRLVKRRFHHDVQDVSTAMMDLSDYQAALTTYRVWIIQQHPSLKKHETEAQNWTKCIVTEDFCNQDAIGERLHALDKRSPSVTNKRLSLRPDQQSQISFLHETLLNDETDEDYQWGLRQLDLVRSKEKPFQLIPTVTAIFVYLARTPRAHVNLQRLFETQHMAENNRRPAYFSTVDGAEHLSAPRPYFNNDNSFAGQRPNIRIPSATPQPWDYGYAPRPPMAPDAPYNPHGPPSGFPPPLPPPPTATRPIYSSVDRRIPQAPRTGFPRGPQRRGIITESSSDSDSIYESSVYRGEHSKKQPKEETRLISRLVSKRVLSDLAYPWRDEGRYVVVLKNLDEDQLEEILRMSEDHRTPEDGLNFDPSNQMRPRRNSIDDEARHSALQPKTHAVGRQDHSLEKVRVPTDEGHALGTAAANATDRNMARRFPYRQRSLLRDSKLRRKSSDMYLRSRAIARLGIPESEARAALEANRVLDGLERSVSELDTTERRPLYHSQFESRPYDPQRNADDQMINQLLVECTPQGASVHRGTEPASAWVRPKNMAATEIDKYEEDADLSESSAFDDDLYGSCEHSSVRDLIPKTPQTGEPLWAELHDAAFADHDVRTKTVKGAGIDEEAILAGQNDPMTEIERPEGRLATLKSMRGGKTAQDIILAPAAMTQPTPPRMPAQSQMQEGPDTAAGATNVVVVSSPTQPTIQRRVTVDEVEDEEDTSKQPAKHHPPPELEYSGDRADKPERASALPETAKTAGAELEWEQRVLEDTTAFSEPPDRRGRRAYLESPSRRSVRAAQREASKHKKHGRRRLQKGAVG
ncbi:hypothetical protein KVR01_008938 [Diaporthe batatas]|uniref:uncharacterized protein n=1 Tax=Diaporthe batatas TaxID=748121 RepID=UPI001D056D3A|nr:uncharacterized protein KVR01_008938 [Diaporthe batatas]KAG8160674.1 hypothetical protein KVR01_008938 [Diaporthe batatas]